MLSIWYKKTLINSILYPFSLVYGGLSSLNIQKRSKNPYKPSSYVISIGNITMGGSGKTPVTIAIANFLASKGMHVAVVGHGYKAKMESSEVVDGYFPVNKIGDEAKQMSELLDAQILLIVGKSRIDSIKLAEERKVDVIILDDAFSATHIHRDYNIAVVDGKTQLGNKMVFPAGCLREPISGLERADSLIVINRHNKINFDFDEKIYYLKSKISFNKNLKTQSLFAFCALALPHKFYNSLTKEGLCVKQTKSFKDHHKYTKEEILALIKQAKNEKLALVTTHKDMVKIDKELKKDIELINLEVELTKTFKDDLVSNLQNKAKNTCKK